MAYEESLRQISLDADPTIGIFTGTPGLPGSAVPNNGRQYYWLAVTGERMVGLATAATDPIAGILQNKPQMVGAAAGVGFAGVSMMQIGAVAVAAGDRVGPGPDGAGITVADGPGIALSSGVAGAVIPVLLTIGK
jgi:hypothetical protein